MTYSQWGVLNGHFVLSSEYEAIEKIAQHIGRSPEELNVDIYQNSVVRIEIVDTANNLKQFRDMALLSNLKNLEEIVMWGNAIEEICGLSKMWKLKSLILNHNKIKKITGLDNCPLTYLDIRNNPLDRDQKDVISNLRSQGVYVRF